MEHDEAIMQEEKILLIQRMVALLEEIAFNTSMKLVERPTYLERVYASYEQSSAKIHGDVRAQSPARAGKVPEYDPATISRLRKHIDTGPSQSRPEVKKP